MYIALITSKDETLLKELLPLLQEKFDKIKFNTYEMGNRGFQLRLEGSFDESEPQKFVNEYLKTYSKKKKEEIKVILK
jgi:hypothetical protein